MKKRKALIGIGLLALSVVLLSIVYQKQLGDTYREVISLTSNNSYEYRSRTLKRPVSFTNQMFIYPFQLREEQFGSDRYIASLYHNDLRFDPYFNMSREIQDTPLNHLTAELWMLQNPNSIVTEYTKIREGEPPYEPYSDPILRFWTCRDKKGELFSRIVEPEAKPIYVGYWTEPQFDEIHYSREYNSKKFMEIELNPKLQSTLKDNTITVTNNSKDKIRFSSNYRYSIITVLFDEDGTFRDVTPAISPPLSQWHRSVNLSSDGFYAEKHPAPAMPTCLEPVQSLTFHLPQFRPEEKKLKLSLFFVIVGDNDKIIHIFETPCEK